MSFGREYIIPKPFDPRVLTRVAPAVAQAAMDTGVARTMINDMDKYRHELEVRMGRSYEIMHNIYNKAKTAPKKIILSEGDNQKIIKSATIAYDNGIALPILLGNAERIKQIALENNYDLTGIEIVDPNNFEVFLAIFAMMNFSFLFKQNLWYELPRSGQEQPSKTPRRTRHSCKSMRH